MLLSPSLHKLGWSA